jgi:hypothetical protein
MDIVLENQLTRAVFDANSGALLQLSNKQSGREFQGRRELARSFLMVVPLPERTMHVIDGLNQRPAAVTQTPSRVEFTWESLRSQYAEMVDIRLRCSASLSEAGLRFEISVKNSSPYPVESLAWPYFGDLQRPANGQFRRANCTYCTLVYMRLSPEFPNERGYWGTEYPIQTVGTPDSPWVLILDETDGLYVGCHDTSAKERVDFTFQLKPGYGEVGEVPKTDTIGGQSVRIEFFATHLPFVQSGESSTLAPVVVMPFRGDWHDGADIYKAWRRTWMTPPRVPAWISTVHSWQMLQMNTSGDSLRIRYNDLPEYAAECARNGVAAIQLIGWTLDGQDGRLPIHDIDRRLGSRDDLRIAIAKAREIGVQIVLYEKYTFADIGTEWYKRELYRYASRDLNGNQQQFEGYRYDTPAYLAGINIRPFAWMCMNSSKWRDVAIEEIRKSLDLDPAGIFLDESFNHGSNGLYCFDPSHGHHVPAYNFAGDSEFEIRLRSLLDSRGPEMVLAGEAPYDLQNRHYTLSYTRASVGHIAAMRYIDPLLPMMNWVHGFDDREGVNICLLYRYIISYEPRDFRGRLAEFPLTLEYGQNMDALRTRYKEFLWDAEFQDTRGAAVEVAWQGQPASGEECSCRISGSGEVKSGFVYSVFRNRESGRKAVVLVNHRRVPALAKVDTGWRSRLMAVSPENQELRCADDRIRIEARSAVVVMESRSRPL